MKNTKKIVSLSMAAALLAGSTTAFAIPTNTVVIGDKAYTMEALFDSSLEAEIKAALADAGDKLYYDLGNDDVEGFTSLFGSTPITEEQKAELGKITVVDVKDGEVVRETYENFDAETPVDQITVSEVTAENTTKLQVTLGTTATEEKLAGKTITLTAGEKTLTATYRASSLASSKAIFDLSGSDVMEDATTYALSSDTFAFDTAEFVAKTSAPYAMSFEKVTTDVVAKYDSNGVAQSTVANLYFNAKDQYGDAIDADSTTAANVKVMAKVNGMPLAAELTGVDGNDALNVFEDGNAKITIEKVLKENDTVEVSLVKYDKEVTATDKKALETSTFSYTVIKGDEAVATTIDSVVAKYNASANSHVVGKDATEVLPNDEITLTAAVKDQYNNPVVDAGAGNKLVRWVVTEGKELIAADGTTDLTSGTLDTQTNEVELKAVKPGTLTVEAYNIANGAKATYTVVIGASKLTGLTLTSENPATTYNQEAVKYRTIEQNPTGASLTPEMVKFNVVAKTEGTTTSDITVTAALRGGSDANTANDIVISATTTKAGSYEITPYVGDSFDAEGVVKAPMFTATTTLNPVATTIEAMTVPTIKVGTPQKVAFVAKNKHGESIDISADDLTVAKFKDGSSTTSFNVSELDKDSAAATGTTAVKFLSFAATEKGSFVARVSVSGTAATLDVPVTAEVTTLQTIDLGTAISDNTLIAGTATDKNVIKPIMVKDNKGDAIIDDISTWKLDTKEGTTDVADFATVSYYRTDDEGKLVVTTTKSEAEGIALVYALNGLSDTTDKTYTITVGNKILTDTDVVKDSVEVVVKAKRAIKEITVAPATTNIAVGGTQEVVVTPLDQYGDFFATATDTDASGLTLTTADANIAEAQTTVVAIDKDAKALTNLNDTNTVAYKITVVGNSTGSVKLTVANGSVTKDIDVTVSNAASLVDTVQIAGNLVNADGSYGYVLANNSNGNTSDAGETVNLKLKAFDGSTEVGFDANDVVWSMQDATDATGATIATVSGGVVTITQAPASDTTITVKADLFGKVDTIEIPVVKDYAAAAAVKSSTVALKQAGSVTDMTKIDADADKAGVQLLLDGKTTDGEATDGTMTLTFEGKDGFGTDAIVAGTVLSFNTDVATVGTMSSSAFTITPAGKGTTTVRLTLADGTDLSYDVEVAAENVVDAKKIAQTATLSGSDLTVTFASALPTGVTVTGGNGVTKNTSTEYVVDVSSVTAGNGVVLTYTKGAASVTEVVYTMPN